MFGRRNKMRVNRISAPQATFMKPCTLLLTVCLCSVLSLADQKYKARGIVLKVDPSTQTVLISCKEIPAYMDAMAMSFSVHDFKTLDTLRPGEAVEFTLVVKKTSSYAESIHPVAFESLELDPTEVRRLQLLERFVTQGSEHADSIAIGQTMPDFTLVDQNR